MEDSILINSELPQAELRGRLMRGPRPVATCSICLSPAVRPGCLDSCEHKFCLACIYRWTQQSNACPCCRQIFTCVWDEEDPSCMVEVEPPPAKPGDAAYEEADDAWGCQYCGSREDEDRMLLCDGCDAAWHLWCLNPPLTCVPTGDWYCQQCEPIGQARRREQARHRLHSAIADLYADEGEADGSNAPAPRPDGSSTSGVTAASMTTATGPTMAEEAASSSSSSTYRISRRRLQARRQEPGLPIGAAASSSSAITLAEAWCSAAGSAGARCAMCSAEGCPGHFPPDRKSVV